MQVKKQIPKIKETKNEKSRNSQIYERDEDIEALIDVDRRTIVFGKNRYLLSNNYK